MPSIFKFVTASCFFTLITGQFGLEKLVNISQLPLPEKIPGLQHLPTPLNFLETLLNVTATELEKIVAEFDFDDVLSDHITFLLYQQNGSIVVLNLDSDGDYIDISEPIKFIIHGWQSTGEHDFIKDFAKSYHRIGIHNVLGVDWSPHSKRNYLHSARGTKKVGEIVAQFIMKIIRNNTELLPNVHIIGHSLGAQSSGFAGKHIQKLTNGLRIGRITALDAAGPFFEFPIKLPKHLRINNDDAEYVDGMHTNIGFLGFLAPYADADYYVDFGGPIQTGCMNVNIFEAFGCSHAKSYQIFNRTIISREYLATPCGSPLRAIANLCKENTKSIMGEHTSTDAQGDFFINIDNNSLPDRKERKLRFYFGGTPGTI